MSIRVSIYGNQDSGSLALAGLCLAKGVPYEMRDIRKRDENGEMVDLAFLMERNLRSVPQVFIEDEYQGDYERFTARLAGMPKPRLRIG